MKRTILYAAAALLLGGCFKSVGYDTDVILKSWVSGRGIMPDTAICMRNEPRLQALLRMRQARKCM